MAQWALVLGSDNFADQSARVEADAWIGRCGMPGTCRSAALAVCSYAEFYIRAQLWQSEPAVRGSGLYSPLPAKAVEAVHCSPTSTRSCRIRSHVIACPQLREIQKRVRTGAHLGKVTAQST